jgi:hypothetical protein
MRASEWFRENIHDGDTMFLKLNCEDSECDIIEDLLASGDLARIFASMIDFDVRKIPSQRHREAETREKLAQTGLKNYYYCEDVMIGSTHIARIQNWLHEVGADRCPTTTKIRQAAYLLRAPAKVRRAVLGGTSVESPVFFSSGNIEIDVYDGRACLSSHRSVRAQKRSLVSAPLNYRDHSA